MSGSENLPIGPGILGFIAVFVLALALWLLMRNMNARMRRMAYRDRAAGRRPDRAGHDDSAGPNESPGPDDSAGPGDSAGSDPAGPANDA